MLPTVRLVLVPSLLALAFTAACGSQPEDAKTGSLGAGTGTGGGSGTGLGGGSSETNPDTDIVVSEIPAGGSTSVGIPDDSDGGSVPLSQDQLDAIQEAECTGWSAEGETGPAILQLVVDVSGSMEDDAPGSDQSKWQITRAALEDAMAGLPPSVAVGVLYYPNQEAKRGSTPAPVTDCVNVDDLVPISALGNAGSPQRMTIDQSLVDAETGSRTPTHDAYLYALEESLLPYQSEAQKFMLLITDGAPTLSEGCLDPGDGSQNGADAPTDPIIAAIQKAYDEHSVETFLIGSPGSEMSSRAENGDMRPWLSQAAVVGGTAADGCEVDGPNFCHMDMTQEPDFGAALTAGLAAVAGQIVDSCVFQIPAPPAGQTVDPALTNVFVTNSGGKTSLLLPDVVGDCSVGWQLTADDEVTLCGESCDALKADAGATVVLSQGCSRDDIQVVTK